MTKVISVVSGKGGAGKSLLTAVIGRALAREGKRVLLLDLDIFVRGLTVLLYGIKRPERSIAKYTTSDLLGIFDSKSSTRNPVGDSPTGDDADEYLVERFLECDVLPAVDNIAAPLDYDDRCLSDAEFCYERLSSIVGSLKSKYDFIIIDNRAGMDSLVLAACRNSDVVLSIAEDDDVGRQTNVNLVRFLQNRARVRIVYTIINKGRGIESYKDVEDRARNRSEYSVLGVVPFDMEVMKTFGRDRFWTDVTSTLYFRSIIDCWNELSKAENVIEISKSKYNFPPQMFMSKNNGRFTLAERILRVYGTTAVFAGVSAWIYFQFMLGRIGMESVIPMALIAMGFLLFLLSTSGFQDMLYGINKNNEDRSK